MISLMRIAPCIFCLFISLGSASTGYGYILPAERIVDLMIGQLGSAHSLEIGCKVIIYDPELEGGMQELNGTLYYQSPNQSRSELSGPGGDQILVANSGGAIFVTNGVIVSDTEAPQEHFKDLLLYRNKDELVRRLLELGVDLETVSLGRFKDRIAYVIGAKYPDESVPQVWIEKDTFRPIRYVVRGLGPNGMDLEEIEYENYTSPDKKSWYPGRILFSRNGGLAQTYVLKQFRFNPDLPDELFDIADLRGLHEPTASPGPAAPSEVDEVKKTIRDFSKTFE